MRNEDRQVRSVTLTTEPHPGVKVKAQLVPGLDLLIEEVGILLETAAIDSYH